MKRLLLVLCFVLCPTTAKAIETVTFDHFHDKQSIQSIEVSEGGFFIVKIINSCDKFKVHHTGLERKERKIQPLEIKTRERGITPESFLYEYLKDYEGPKAKGCIVGDDIILRIPHDPKYGGYRIDILLKKEKGPINAIKFNEGASKASILYELNNLRSEDKNVEGFTRTLDKNIEHGNINETFFIVEVKGSPWHVDFAGGFTVSFLTDEKFGVRSNGTDNVVFRDTSAEDDVNLGFAGFIHTYNEKWFKRLGKYDVTFVPLSFGLGINDDNEVNYFVGISAKFGKSFLTAGVNFGPTETLPTGVTEGSIITDPNTLNNLNTKTEASGFIGFSYTFIGTGDIFQKPFATPTSE